MGELGKQARVIACLFAIDTTVRVRVESSGLILVVSCSLFLCGELGFKLKRLSYEVD